MARKSNLGGELVTVGFLMILVIVAVWFIEKSGGIAYWLSRASSDTAGAVSSGAASVGVPLNPSGAISNALASFVGFFSQWYTGNDPAAAPSDGGVAPYFDGWSD